MTGAKPLYRFRDRALAGLMAARGWESECPLSLVDPPTISLFTSTRSICMISSSIARGREFSHRRAVRLHRRGSSMPSRYW
jgi:hypothetical protein